VAFWASRRGANLAKQVARRVTGKQPLRAESSKVSKDYRAKSRRSAPAPAPAAPEPPGDGAAAPSPALGDDAPPVDTQTAVRQLLRASDLEAILVDTFDQTGYFAILAMAFRRRARCIQHTLRLFRGLRGCGIAFTTCPLAGGCISARTLWAVCHLSSRRPAWS
jgi:hypothetical protein